MEDHDIDRRTFVRTGAAVGTLALAGCMGEDGDDPNESESDDAADARPPFPEIEDKPDAVYLPTHRESMRTLEPVAAGDYRLAPMLSYPHPFWNVVGDEVRHSPPDSMVGVHMMFVLWDDETGVVLPVDSGNRVALARDGQRVGSPQSLWSMLSQEMGFHFGDNVVFDVDEPTDADGTYAVEVELPPLSVRTTGDLEGRFTDRETATFEFDYDESFREAVSDVDYFDEQRWGERGALEPMDHDRVPYSQLPEVDAFPGTLLVDADGDGPPNATADLPRSGGAAVLATLLESDHRLSDGDGRYLLVSPRTPYNRVPLPNMSLAATVERDGEPVTDGSADLVQTIDGEYALHYGTTLADVQPGDTVRLTVRTPPQVARHQGYDTAFLEMPPLELTVPEGDDAD